MTRTAPLPHHDPRLAIGAIADKQAIANCLAIHSRGIDRNDVALMRSAYHPDAEVDYGMFTGSAMELCHFVTDGTKDFPVSLHRPCNLWIKLDGPERARAESYIIAYLELPDAGGAMTQVFVGGRYLDRLEKRAGVWKLAHRTYVMDWNSTHPSTVAWTSGIGAALTLHGAHRERDPGNQRLAAWTKDFRETRQGHSAMTDIDRQIDAVLSRDAIHGLLMAYCRGVDRGDAALLASVWHPDAEVETGMFDGNGLAYADAVIAGTTGLKRCFHSIANEWIDIDGDHAVAESYVIALTTAPSDQGDQDCLVGGRYLNRFERRDGVWKISRHAFVMDWNINQPSTAVWDEGMFAALKLRGTRGKSDPVYAFWN